VPRQAIGQPLTRVGPLDVRSISARSTMPPIFSGHIDRGITRPGQFGRAICLIPERTRRVSFARAKSIGADHLKVGTDGHGKAWKMWRNRWFSPAICVNCVKSGIC